MSEPIDPAVRGAGYRLLSGLYLTGVTGDSVETVREIPDLAAWIGPDFDFDDAAAEHHRLFELQVLPYASVFLEEDGTLGGDVTASVERTFDNARVGRVGSEPADHLGRFLGLLAEVTARDDEEAVLEVLDGHLLWWLPSFIVTLERHADPFWRAVAGLTLASVLDQRLAHTGLDAPDHDPPWGIASSPQRPSEDSAADIRDWAAYLVLPARCGLYLAEADVRALGRAQRLPGGFGNRIRVLENVLLSAEAYQAEEAFIGGLRGIVGRTRAELEGLADARRLPRAFVEPWIRRIEETEAALPRILSG